MTPEKWQRLLDTVADIQQWFPDGVAFIGGIAVYAHLKDREKHAQLAAMSHDADFFILVPDFVDLRDLEVVTPNRRLDKAQFIKNGFEFDVYVEHQNSLIIPAGEAVAESENRMGLRVVCLEHLLLLKVMAFLDRRGSAKGDKDEDDIARILLSLEDPNRERLTRLDDDMLAAIEKAVAADTFVRLAKGNHHRARELRTVAMNSLESIRMAYAAITP